MRLTLTAEAASATGPEKTSRSEANPACLPNTYTVSATERGDAVQVQLRNVPLDTSAAAQSGILDPLWMIFDDGPSWYSGLWSNATHLIAAPSGAESHIDPYGPLNPFHFLSQVIGGWMNGTQNLGVIQCSVTSGCGG